MVFPYTIWTASHPATIDCICKKQFTINRALSFPFGAIWHNKVRDITAHLLSYLCHNVGLEPQLQLLSGKSLNLRTKNKEEGAWLDIKAHGFNLGRLMDNVHSLMLWYSIPSLKLSKSPLGNLLLKKWTGEKEDFWLENTRNRTQLLHATYLQVRLDSQQRLFTRDWQL